MRNAAVCCVAPLALGLLLASPMLAADDLVVVGGPDPAAVERRTIEFETLTDGFLDTQSTRLVDERRLLRAERARGLVFAEDAVTVVKPAVPKPSAKAFVRPSRDADDRRVEIPARAIGEAAADEEPGWGQLRITNPEGRDRVYRIGTPSKSDASDARGDVYATASLDSQGHGRFSEVRGIDAHQSRTLEGVTIRQAPPVRSSMLRHRLPHPQYMGPHHPCFRGFYSVPDRLYLPHFRSYEYRHFRSGGGLFENPSARYRFFRYRDFD